MYQGRYFMMPNGFNYNYMIPRNYGLFDGFLRKVKEFNWKGLLTGTSKTISVINQTIPLIKEVKPVINNVRSIMQLTKAFNKETTGNKNISNSIQEVLPSTKINDDTPTFFI